MTGFEGWSVSGALARWDQAARALTWATQWDSVYDGDEPPGRWFRGGTLNVSVNCLDRHLPDRADRVAIYWEGEPGDRRAITYGALHAEVCAFSAALRGLGVSPGDRVALHLGSIPEAVVGMLACARLGAVHVVLPASLPPDALADRLADTEPKVLVTQDGAWRHGVILPLKARADEALAAVASVDHTVVIRRVGIDVAWYEGDRWYHDLVGAPRRRPRKASGSSPGNDPSAPAAMPADHPLLAVGLASRRGHPSSILHRTAGFFTAAATIHQRALTTGDDDVFWCAAEIGWILGQAHGVYGPLANGATTVMFEGTLDVPTHARTWEVIDRYAVTVLLTTPSVVRNLRQWVDTPPSQAKLESLRLIVTGGEAIDAATRNWLAFEVGRAHATVADGWGQTELGGMVTLTTAPDHSVGKSIDGSAAGDQPPVPDPGVMLLDDGGRPVPDGEPGEIVLANPWPGTFLEIEGNPEATRSYWGPYPGFYATGDLGLRDPTTGTVAVLGRKDPVVSISGQLVSLTEIKGVLIEHPYVSDAEVVPRSDERRGVSIAACVVLSDKAEATGTLAGELAEYVHDLVGGLARPRAVAFVEAFPPDLTPDVRARALRLLCAANPAEWFTVTAAQLAAAATATD